MRIWLRSFLLLAVLGTVMVTHAEPLQVVYPRAVSERDTRATYYVRLLDLVMRKSGQPYVLQPYALPTVGSRMIYQLANNTQLTVIWAPSTQELNRLLTAVPISIDKGILGWRLLLINKTEGAAFAKVRTLDQLRQLKAGLDRDWADTFILRANGMPVVDAVGYDGLFHMLAAGRFAYFPRGAAEVWGEAERFAGLGLMVEPRLALHYPMNTYFFVNKSNATLKSALEQGLRVAMEDGSFERLFEEYNGAALRRARLSERTVFELALPTQPCPQCPAPR